MTYRFYRGCSMTEAKELVGGIQTKDFTHWTDSGEKAAMYARRYKDGAIVCFEVDELPVHWNTRKSVAEGDAVHGNIPEWRIPRQYFNQDRGLWCMTEEARIFLPTDFQ
ncbi:hypothetical protein KNU84_gp093 [Bacteriophage DSS3_VP1]|uniref:Uncharacterized protein n=1 Tax=Bacteriophage DSS3_VP1 TaxID=2664196 RepID=A0A7S5FSX9_9CAUD|nr:hypothetical protein KNU84_gp093 [Bacteriophage DSS3_VP1]QGH74611.1 hypothetical protein DSS3VP1_00043 [Bacteriophage DSS3_VP1]